MDVGLSSGSVLFVLVLILVIPAILQWFWNITFPDLFGWPSLTYGQAFRMMIIAGILFGGSHFSFQNTGGVETIHFGL